MEQFVLVVLPYVTITVLVAGLVWRIRTWWKKPRAKAVLFPAARNGIAVAAGVARDILLFGKTSATSKSLWIMTVAFHLGLLLVALGHLRTLTEFGFLWSWLNLDEKGIDSVSFAMGMTAGGLILTGVVLLLARRLTPTMRVLSIFQDYFVLGMLLAIILSGLAMRLWMPLHVDEIQSHVRGVLTLSPSVAIHNSLFLWHLLMAEILIMYLPFSKLIHLVSKPLAESWTMR